jgi:DNA primase
MTISQNTIEQIKTNILPSQLVGRYVVLKKQGERYAGLCPFHAEKTPSFTVNDQRGFYHCFGCGAHGDIISFVAEKEGLSFTEAVAKLASELGIEISRQEGEHQYKQLNKILHCAALWFVAKFWGETGKDARRYLKNRGVLPKTAKKFQLGFAPAADDALEHHLRSEGFSISLMEEAGLIQANRPLFRNRLIFPIYNHRNLLIGFGGRVINENQRPKYLNSSESPVFKKSQVLYGYNFAQAGMRDAAIVVLVEGYTDVMALHQVGIRNAVAPLGTACGLEHIQKLWAISKEPVICFDGDDAGRRAMLRIAKLALSCLKSGYSMKFAVLPEDSDPASVVSDSNSNDTNPIGSILEDAKPLSDFLLQSYTAGGTKLTPEERASVEVDLMECASTIKDETVRSYYRRFFKQKLWEFYSVTKKPAKNPAKEVHQKFVRLQKSQNNFGRYEALMLRLMLEYPEMLNCTEINQQFVSLCLHDQSLRDMRKIFLEVGGILGCSERQKMLEYIAAFCIQSIFFAAIDDTESAQKMWSRLYLLRKLEILKNDYKEAIRLAANDDSNIMAVEIYNSIVNLKKDLSIS